jgi:hypothetical protein
VVLLVWSLGLNFHDAIMPHEFLGKNEDLQVVYFLLLSVILRITKI